MVVMIIVKKRNGKKTK